MLQIRDYFKFGITVALLYPEALQSPQRHLAAFSKAAHFEEYETLETFLPAEELIRKTEILSEHAQQYGITLALEPAERGVFKNLVLGPTSETVACVSALQKAGRANVKILIDTAHIPLMKEDQIDALKISLEVGIGHIHLGNAVIRNPNSKYYGHIHPPIGIHEGEYDVDDVSDFLYHLFECGYISRTPGKELRTISLEMVPYPGVSSETSARVAYEKIRSALQKALSRK